MGTWLEGPGAPCSTVRELHTLELRVRAGKYVAFDAIMLLKLVIPEEEQVRS
jgi:hypothetical protein